MLSELEDGADITATDSDGWTLLHWAARCNKRTDVIELLLEHGADVDAKTNDNETPLLVAIYPNSDPAVTVLSCSWIVGLTSRLGDSTTARR